MPWSHHHHASLHDHQHHQTSSSSSEIPTCQFWREVGYLHPAAQLVQSLQTLLTADFKCLWRKIAISVKNPKMLKFNVLKVTLHLPDPNFHLRAWNHSASLSHWAMLPLFSREETTLKMHIAQTEKLTSWQAENLYLASYAWVASSYLCKLSFLFFLSLFFRCCEWVTAAPFPIFISHCL